MHNICKSALLSICEAHMIQYNFILELIKCKIVFLVLNLGIVGTFMILCLGPLSRSAHICESRFLLAQIPHFHQKKNQYMSGLVQVPCLFKIQRMAIRRYIILIVIGLLLLTVFLATSCGDLIMTAMLLFLSALYKHIFMLKVFL